MRTYLTQPAESSRRLCTRSTRASASRAFLSDQLTWYRTKRLRLHDKAQQAVNEGLGETAPLLSEAASAIGSRSGARKGSRSRNVSRSSTLTPRSGTSTPVLSFDGKVPPSKVPHLVSDKQHAMIDNLTKGLPQLERLIAWFPWVYNSHAMLVVR